MISALGLSAFWFVPGSQPQLCPPNTISSAKSAPSQCTVPFTVHHLCFCQTFGYRSKSNYHTPLPAISCLWLSTLQWQLAPKSTCEKALFRVNPMRVQNTGNIGSRICGQQHPDTATTTPSTLLRAS